MRRFRPLTLGDVFDEAFDLYKKNFAFFFLVGAVAAVPLKIVVAIVSLRFLRSFLGVASAFGGSGTPDPTQIFGWLGSLAGGAALFLPFYVLVYGLEMVALAAATSACYLGEPITISQCYRPALRRFFPLLGAAFLWAAWHGLGLLGCYVGVLVPLTLFAFTAHAFALENKGAASSLGRSKTLVSGYGSSVFGCLFLVSLLYTILSTGIELPFGAAFEGALQLTPGAGGLLGGGVRLGGGVSLREQVIGQIGEGISQLLLLPLVVSTLTVLFYDLRVRREAFDMELLARDLGYPPLSALPAFLPPTPPVVSLPPTPPISGARR